MGHGGRRRGAGRRIGAVTRRTREVADAAAAEGVTPLDYMLTVMRDPTADVQRRDEMAALAAPYVHPRLSAISTDLNVKVGVTTVNIISVPDGHQLTDAQLRELSPTIDAPLDPPINDTTVLNYTPSKDTGPVIDNEAPVTDDEAAA
jgi:hypothetical protein